MSKTYAESLVREWLTDRHGVEWSADTRLPSGGDFEMFPDLEELVDMISSRMTVREPNRAHLAPAPAVPTSEEVSEGAMRALESHRTQIVAHEALRKALEKIRNGALNQGPHTGMSWKQVVDICQEVLSAHPTVPAPVNTVPSAEAFRKALGSAKGTLNYIRVQAVAGHPGFNMVAKMNADEAIKKIDAVLEGSHHG